MHMTNTTDTNPTPATFEIGSTYDCRWATDHTMTTPHTVVARSAKFITLQPWGEPDGSTVRVGVKVDSEGEWCLPFGQFSMAPVMRASRVAVAA